MEGQFVEGRFTHGTVKLHNGVIYEGEVDDYYIHGRGKELWPDGEEYEGTYFHGEKRGRGRWFYKNHEYIGEFKAGKRNGKGWNKWSNGNEYEGDWVDDKPHGKGKMSYTDGLIYEGEFKNGERDGIGALTSNLGDTQEGNWVHNKRNGIFNITKVGLPSHITCLLYTSPSPRDLSTSRMPSSA
eukprot:TRINITY_DN15221_c0_g1_i1.p1 TRINITY_DN15221_c0_g1~~TRINITY_DN15221_c0_g1_i1.p1  ORF type:complete len:184 (-),score=30.70 TRINITY_DN15221_c0_g1_i1:144-695(-)